MKTNVNNLILTYLVRSAGITVGLFTIFGLYILYEWGLGTLPAWVQIIAILTVAYSILLLVPLRVLSRSRLIRHTYITLGIHYILIICISLEILISLPIIAVVLLHFYLLIKMANKRTHSIANPSGDPVKTQAAQSDA